MAEELKKITLFVGNVSLEKELGSYYIDMRPSISHYQTETNIYGGGIDENGVPFCANKLYFPINIAQYGFILHAQYMENKDEKILENLLNIIKKLDELKTVENGYCVWWHNYYSARYDLQPPWASAMAQGELMSLYLRIYQITNDEKLLETAKQAYSFLKIDFKDGGVRRLDQNNDLWFEEYPSQQPSLVLNGFIYTLFGLYDLYRVTKDEDVKKDIDYCIETLKNSLHKYDVGYWSLYDQKNKELVRYYYQKNVHVPQMKILYLLTNEKIFNKYAKKWEKNVNWLNFQFVKIMYRIRPRW